MKDLIKNNNFLYVLIGLLIFFIIVLLSTSEDFNSISLDESFVSENVEESIQKKVTEKVEEKVTEMYENMQETDIIEAEIEMQSNSDDYICSYNAYNCVNFSSHSEAQEVYELCGGLNNDIHALDRDKDKLACEALP